MSNHVCVFLRAENDPEPWRCVHCGKTTAFMKKKGLYTTKESLEDTQRLADTYSNEEE